MEVMLATAILLGCTVVLVELSNQGRRNSMAALDQATAQTICLGYVNEMLAGIRPVEQQETMTSEEHPGWTIGVEVEPLDRQGISAVTVTVEQEENKLGKPQSYSLTRWMSDRTSDEIPEPINTEALPEGLSSTGDLRFGSTGFGSTELNSVGSPP